MLKKVGVVVAVVAAGMLSVSPLAFASDSGDEQHGLVNIDDVAVQVPVQACGNDVLSGVFGLLAKDLENESDDEVDCEQEAEVEND